MKGITWGRVTRSDAQDTVIIVASGPSLTGFNFERIRGKGHIIAVNGSGNSVPFGDSWFTLDPWGIGPKGQQLPTKFAGRLYAAVPEDFATPNAQAANHRVMSNPEITYLHRLRQHNHVGVSSETAYKIGLSEDSSCISTGNSGYGALNLAYHLRPKKIILLGIDGSIGYHYTKSSTNRPLTYLPQMFESTVEQMQRAGIEVINGSLNSAITCYPRMSVDDALKEIV